MTSDGEQVLVLTDDEGNYYTITPELLQLARVGTDEHKAKIQELTAGRDDVSGYSFALTATTQFRPAGTFLRTENPYLRASYFAPRVSGVGAYPPPPS